MRRPNRNWILFVVILGIGLTSVGLTGRRAWLAWQNHQVNRWVQSYGGTVTWDFQFPGSGPTWTPEPAQRLFGGEPVLDDIISVSLSGSPAVRVEEIRMLSRLPGLKFVSLKVSGISDGHVKLLTRSRSITHLDLSDTEITDEGLLLISRRLNRLIVLEVANTEVSGRGLSEIGNLTRLESLNLEGTQVGDADLHFLQTLPGLTELHLGERVTDRGIREITQLEELLTLSFERSPITDTGIDELNRDAPKLKNLFLFDTEVSSAKKKEIGYRDGKPEFHR